VFDLDGTLVDSFEAITESVNHARRVFDLPAMDHGDIKSHVGRGLEVLMADLVGPDLVEEGVRAFRDRYATAYAAGTTLLPGVHDALARLSDRGIRMSVASNKPARFGRPICEQLGIDKFFCAILGPDVVGTTKPHPAMLERAITEMAVQTSDAIYVGDMLLDIETAAQAGVTVALVATGSCSEADLRMSGETTVSVLRELADLLLDGTSLTT